MRYMPDTPIEGNTFPHCKLGNRGQRMTHLTGSMVLLPIPRCQLLRRKEMRIAIGPRFPAALVSLGETMRSKNF